MRSRTHDNLKLRLAAHYKQSKLPATDGCLLMHNANNSSEDDPINSRQNAAHLARLADVIRQQRETLGLSIANVSEQTNLSVSHISALEQGDWDIDLISLLAIADTLKFDLKHLWDSVEEQPVPLRQKTSVTREDGAVMSNQEL